MTWGSSCMQDKCPCFGRTSDSRWLVERSRRQKHLRSNGARLMRCACDFRHSAVHFLCALSDKNRALGALCPHEPAAIGFIGLMEANYFGLECGQETRPPVAEPT